MRIHTGDLGLYGLSWRTFVESAQNWVPVKYRGLTRSLRRNERSDVQWWPRAVLMNLWLSWWSFVTQIQADRSIHTHTHTHTHTHSLSLSLSLSLTHSLTRTHAHTHTHTYVYFENINGNSLPKDLNWIVTFFFLFFFFLNFYKERWWNPVGVIAHWILTPIFFSLFFLLFFSFFSF